MRRTRLMIRLSVCLLAAILSLQADMLPFLWHSSVLFDRVVSQAQQTPELKDAALRFLRVVAEGRKGEMSPELLAAFSYRKDLFQPFELADVQGRAKAFEQIGRLATPDALAYLESVDLSQFTAVEDQPIARSIPLGIFLARAAQISDPQRRWEFYAETLRHPPEGLGRDGPLARAYRGLCTEGALSFLPDVEVYIRRGRTSARPDEADRIKSCKEMMHLVATHPSRAAGLEAALHVDAGVFGEYFRSWAIRELGDMHTRESRAILEKFVLAAKAKIGPNFETREAAIRQDPRLSTDLSSAKLTLTLSPQNDAFDRKE